MEHTNQPLPDVPDNNSGEVPAMYQSLNDPPDPYAGAADSQDDNADFLTPYPRPLPFF